MARIPQRTHIDAAPHAARMCVTRSKVYVPRVGVAPSTRHPRRKSHPSGGGMASRDHIGTAEFRAFVVAIVTDRLEQDGSVDHLAHALAARAHHLAAIPAESRHPTAR